MAGQRSPVFIADDRVIVLGDDPNRHFLKKIHFPSLCCSLDTSDSADASSVEQADCLAPFPRLVGVLEPILKIFADRF